MGENTIVLAGGSGYLGRVLTGHFTRHKGGRVIVLSRRPPETWGRNAGVEWLTWDGETSGEWTAALEGATAVVNLAGRSVNCRYNARNRRGMIESRLRPTAVLGEAITRCAAPPRVWLNASSATIYRHALDRPMDEATGEIGSGFSVDVCRQWERAFFDAPTPPATRKAALRTAIVFGATPGGAFDAFRGLAHVGLGGPMGGGRQYVSWIHEADFARAVEWLITREDLSGPVNVAAPNPLPNADFLRLLRRACGQPVGIPSARWMLEVGALLLGTETELLLKSRRVVPGTLTASGFAFRFPAWEEALPDLIPLHREVASNPG